MADLPAPLNSLRTLYHLDDSKSYGNQRAVVGTDTNTLLIWDYYFNDTVALDASFLDAINNFPTKQIIFGPNTAPTDTTLTAAALAGMAIAKNYWSSVTAIYFDEMSLTQAQMQALIVAFKAWETSNGLAHKPIWANFTIDQVVAQTASAATNIDVIGFELYTNAAQQDNPVVTTLLNTHISTALAFVVGRPFFVVAQGFDRNGAWTNYDSLKNLQSSWWPTLYNNSNLQAVFIFSWLRPGGTASLPFCIRNEQRRVLYAIAGRPQPSTISCTDGGGGDGGGTSTVFAIHCGDAQNVSPLPFDKTFDTRAANHQSGFDSVCGSGNGYNGAWFYRIGSGSVRLRITVSSPEGNALVTVLTGTCGGTGDVQPGLIPVNVCIKEGVTTFIQEPGIKYYFLLTTSIPGGSAALRFQVEEAGATGQFCTSLQCSHIPLSGIYKLVPGKTHDTVYAIIDSINNFSTADIPINGFIETYLVGDADENILHFAGVRLRVTGFGNLIPTWLSLDNIKQRIMNVIPMQDATNIEPFKLGGFVQQRARLRLETAQMDARFFIQKIVMFVKGLYTQHSGR